LREADTEPAGTQTSVADFSHPLHLFIDVPDGFTFVTASHFNYGTNAVNGVPGPTLGTGGSSFAFAALFLGWLVRRRAQQAT